MRRTYRPGRSVCFFATRPKLREISAADFRDRVVHHLLVEYLERIWEPVFIHDSFACRKGKGVHSGVRRLQAFLWQAIWKRYGYLAQYFEFDAANWRLVRKFVPPQGLRSVKLQYRHFRWRFPDDALFFRVGRFIEFYDVGVSPVASRLGLDDMRKNRRGARNGFPLGHAGRHLRALLDAGVGVVYIGERASPFGGIRLRAPLWRREKVRGG